MPRVVCEAILARLARIHLTALRFLCAANTKAPSDDPVRRGLFGLFCLIKIIPDIANPSQAKIEPQSPELPKTGEPQVGQDAHF
jgi:hypothetical protein